MPWVPLDVHFYQDPSIEAAAEDAGGGVLGTFAVLLAMAKAQAKGGKIEFTWRSLSHATYSSPDDAGVHVRALVSAGVLSCPESSDRGAVLEFDSAAWKRWNDSAMKAAKREAKKTA